MDNKFNLHELYMSMPLGKRVALFLKTSHYVFWKITLMDLTILVPLSILLGLVLDRAAFLNGPVILLADGAVCGVILYFRIRFRRMRACRYILEKADVTDRLFRRLAEEVEEKGSDEEKAILADTERKIAAMREMAEHLADIAYKEDVLGFRENEDE